MTTPVSLVSHYFRCTFAIFFAVTVLGCGVSSAWAADPIKVVAFDEHDETLQAIIDGEMHGTVVQNPYMYGYKSVEILKLLADGKELPKLDDSFLDLPARQIRMDDAAAFWKDKKRKLRTGRGDAEIKSDRKSVAYVTNGIDPFWTVAAAGAKAAGKKFNVNVLLRFPPKGVADQKRMLESLMVQDEVTGIAVSPIDPKNQGDILNEIGDEKHYGDPRFGCSQHKSAVVHRHGQLRCRPNGWRTGQRGYAQGR